MAGRKLAKASESVKGLSWKLLYGNYRKVVGPERWDALVTEVGGPDVVGMDQMDDVPMEPLNAMCRRLDEVLAKGTGSEIDRIAQKSVVAWANFNKNLVKQLQGHPEKMMEVFATEVHPFFLNDPGASRLVGETQVKGTDGAVTIELPNGLDTGFKAGLLRGFVELTGAKADIRQEDGDGRRFTVAWNLAGKRRGDRMALLANATRMPFLTATWIPVLVGWAVAWHTGHFDAGVGGHWGVLAWIFATASLLHMGANTLNDYFDHKSGADEANYTPTPFSGGSRVIQRGLMAPGKVGALGSLLLALGAIGGIGLLAATGRWELIWFGVAGVLLGVLYTAPPVRLAHRGLGELAVALAFGPVIVVGTWAAFSGQFAWGQWDAALLASVPVALLVAAILYINEFPDKAGDAAAGKRTLVVRLPDAANITLFSLLVLGAYAGIGAAVLVGLLPAWSLLALLTLPMAVWTIRKVSRDHGHAYKLIPANAATILVLHLGTGILLALGIVIGALG